MCYFDLGKCNIKPQDIWVKWYKICNSCDHTFTQKMYEVQNLDTKNQRWKISAGHVDVYNEHLLL